MSESIQKITYNQEEEFIDNYIEEEEFIDNYIEEEDEENDEGFQIEIDDDDDDEYLISLKRICDNFKCYMYNIDCNILQNNNIEIKIPRTFLPITLQIAYGFIQHDIAINLEIDCGGKPFGQCSKVNATHPITGSNFTGHTLVRDAILKFFKTDYQPKSYYRSVPYFFMTSKNPDPSKVKTMVCRGFTEIQSKRALSLCQNNIDDSILFLQTGQLDMSLHLNDCKPPVSYKESQLIYLVLEIAESIYDIQNHCSICHEPIPQGIKPSTCENESCKYAFIEIGAGISLIQEIKRDIYVADLLYTLFLSAVETQFLTPAPPDFNLTKIKQAALKIPSFNRIALLENDQQLFNAVGKDAFHLLQWIILSNRSQLFYLHPKIQLRNFNNQGFQFMSLISSPEQEDVFQQLKRKYGSIFVWHGSPTERWHSIIRNGLKIGSSLGFCCNEIYTAKNSKISLGYARANSNPFNHSLFGEVFNVIALVEVVRLPNGKYVQEKVYVRDPKTGKRVVKIVKGVLNENPCIITFTMEEACIVRFLLVNFNMAYDIGLNPPQYLPSINDILSVQAEKI